MKWCKPGGSDGSRWGFSKVSPMAWGTGASGVVPPARRFVGWSCSIPPYSLS